MACGIAVQWKQYNFCRFWLKNDKIYVVSDIINELDEIGFKTICYMSGEIVLEEIAVMKRISSITNSLLLNPVFSMLNGRKNVPDEP